MAALLSGYLVLVGCLATASFWLIGGNPLFGVADMVASFLENRDNATLHSSLWSCYCVNLWPSLDDTSRGQEWRGGEPEPRRNLSYGTGAAYAPFGVYGLSSFVLLLIYFPVWFRPQNYGSRTPTSGTCLYGSTSCRRPRHPASTASSSTK